MSYWTHFVVYAPIPAHSICYLRNAKFKFNNSPLVSFRKMVKRKLKVFVARFVTCV